MNTLTTTIAKVLEARSDDWDGLDWETDLITRSAEELDMTEEELGVARMEEQARVAADAKKWWLLLQEAAAAALQRRWVTCRDKIVEARQLEISYGDCPITSSIESDVTDAIADWWHAMAPEGYDLIFADLEELLTDLAHGAESVAYKACEPTEGLTEGWLDYADVQTVVDEEAEEDEADATWSIIEDSAEYSPPMNQRGPIAEAARSLWVDRRAEATRALAKQRREQP
jgi:hypothetical protein